MLFKIKIIFIYPLLQLYDPDPMNKVTDHAGQKSTDPTRSEKSSLVKSQQILRSKPDLIGKEFFFFF